MKQFTHIMLYFSLETPSLTSVTLGPPRNVTTAGNRRMWEYVATWQVGDTTIMSLISNAEITH